MSTALLLSNRVNNESTCMLLATDIPWCVPMYYHLIN